MMQVILNYLPFRVNFRYPQKPLYIKWLERFDPLGGTIMKRPNFGGKGIVVD